MTWPFWEEYNVPCFNKLNKQYNIGHLYFLQERLISVAYGLLRQGKYHFLTALREDLLSFLKVQVRYLLITHLKVTSDPGDDTPSLADCMRGMEFTPWLDLLSHVFASMVTQLKAVKVSSTLSECVQCIDSLNGAI